MSKIWFITGATRGLGLDIARAALAAGDRVVATGRNKAALDAVFPADAAVLTVALDVTKQDQARSAVAAAVERFGRIDVLVNNAGYGNLELFEQTDEADVRAQYETNVFGVYNVTRAILPVMRAQRSGRIFNVSSIGGIIGGEACTLYSASKFAVEGFSESLAAEVATFGIHVTIVQPGFFRTDFLDDRSVRFGEAKIEDYAQMSDGLRAFWGQRNHNQAGDPAKLGQALVTLAAHEAPPLRFAAGSDAVSMIGDKIEQLRAELDAWAALSITTDRDDAPAPEPISAGSRWG